MAAKGQAKTGGRSKGTPNKTTGELRESINFVLNSNKDKMNEWITRVAKNSPDKALDLMIKLAEFTLPKLNRTTLSGDEDNPLNITTKEIIFKDMNEASSK
jgi:hypothetical protein